MRNLTFKNLTSEDKKRKVIASTEIMDAKGMRTVIRRHFVCIVKEIKNNAAQRPLPYLNIVKESNSSEMREKFFCKLKRSVFAVYEKRLFLILYAHSLKIDLSAVSQGPS